MGGFALTSDGQGWPCGFGGLSHWFVGWVGGWGFVVCCVFLGGGGGGGGRPPRMVSRPPSSKLQSLLDLNNLMHISELLVPSKHLINK